MVASNAGEDADPNWWRNLKAKPDADIEIGTRKDSVRAGRRRADEAARLWPRLDAAYPEYAAYRRKATREIPVVILEPR